jgi:outer membrane receptor protein involved in Fe transport
LGHDRKLGGRVLLARNRFDSSGQLPLDLVRSGALDRFGYIDPTDGGRVWMGTISGWYARGDALRVSGFVARSLFDLYSNFTFYLQDPVGGDAIQQHDSRLEQGATVRYARVHRLAKANASLMAGGHLRSSEINVGLYSRQGRTPVNVVTAADANISNAAAFVQESLAWWNGRLLASGGLRFDEFRFGVRDRVFPTQSGTEWSGRWQGKASLAFTPTPTAPFTLYLNYGRGINSADARAVIQRPDLPRIATTDAYKAGASARVGRFSLSAALFRIDHSNEQVYIPDDGSFEFRGPSRSYGVETRASIALIRSLAWTASLTKVSNAYYLGRPRVYVDSAPHFVAGSALTLTDWHGWSGSLRMRAINHYRLDGEDPAIVASGHTLFDLSVSRTLGRRLELKLSIDNLTNRNYYETQNYFESRVAPSSPAMFRIHGTPGYPITAMVGVTFRFGGKESLASR